MRVLIEYAHPEPKSFNGAMKDLATKVLRGAGHTVQVSDLYAMKFDPSGGPDDFLERTDESAFGYQREQRQASEQRSFEPQLQAEMEKLAWADFVIFQFPLWWFSLPAILKGWVDRVFAMGFAYDLSRSYDSGIFRGKRGMLVLTTGGPAAAYGPGTRNGELDQLLLHINRGMLYFIGLDVLPPFVAYGAARIAPEQRAQYLENYRARLLAIETMPPLKF
jgi:NAD(P)H dehydrogenase (quinone)